MPITFATVIADAKEKVDETPSDFVPSTSWYRWLDSAIEELWRVFTLCAPDATEAATTFSAASVAIPDNRGIRYVEHEPSSANPTILDALHSVGRTGERGWYRSGATMHVQNVTGTFRLVYLAAPALYRTSIATPQEDGNVSPVLEPFVEFLATRVAQQAASKDETRRMFLDTRASELKSEAMIAAKLQSATPKRAPRRSDNDPLGHWGGR